MMKISRNITLFAAAMLWLGFAAFAPVAAQSVDDSDVTKAIQTEFWGDHVVDANKITVETQQGIVTLGGTVDTILTKERAEAIAETTVGVRGVVNQLEVDPALERSDSKLRKAVDQALLDDPAADSYEVDVAVNDGTVTLTGTVDSWQEKQLSAAVAKNVKGVQALRNEISVEYAAERPDYEIKQDIERRLENDVRVDDYLIDVKVDQEKVTLSGTVGSLAEKRQAEDDAWVAGVKAVDTSALDIKWWARDDMRRMSTYTGRSDEAITKAVKDAFFYDPRVSSFAPNIEVTGGTVILSGTVDNAAAKRAAEEDARNTVGVWRVLNHLQVQPAVIPADNELEKRVREALAEDSFVNRFDITVEAYNGWVYLTGDVNSSFEKMRAETVSEKAKGVVDVTNNLDYEYEWTWKPDWEVEADVADQLQWSPYVDADDVTVTVSDGVVTLTGTVDTWSELDAAATNAWQGGAKDVRNNLTVTYRYYGPYSPYGPPYDRYTPMPGPQPPYTD